MVRVFQILEYHAKIVKLGRYDISQFLVSSPAMRYFTLPWCGAVKGFSNGLYIFPEL